MHLFALQVLLGVVGWYSILWGGATRLLKWVSSLKSLESLLVREKPYFSLWCDCRTPRANDAFLTPPCAGRSRGLWVTSSPHLVAVLPCVLVLCASLLGCFPLCSQWHILGFTQWSFSQTSLSLVELMQRAKLLHKHIGKGSSGMLSEPNHRFQVEVYFAGGFCRIWVKADSIFNKCCQWSCPE